MDRQICPKCEISLGRISLLSIRSCSPIYAFVVPYMTRLYLSSAGCIESTLCNCKAGAGGPYNNVAATWYHLWGMPKKNFNEVPRDKAPTEVPAYWLARMQPRSEDLPFRNVAIVERRQVPCHSGDESAVLLLNAKRPCGREGYKPLSRPVDRVLSSLTLHRLVDGLEEIGQCGMVIDRAVCNNYQPSHNPSTLVELDHDYAFSMEAVSSSITCMTNVPTARVQLPSTELSPDPGMEWFNVLTHPGEW